MLKIIPYKLKKTALVLAASAMTLPVFMSCEEEPVLVSNNNDNIGNDNVPPQPPKRRNAVLDFQIGSQYSKIYPVSKLAPYLTDELIDTVFINNTTARQITEMYLPGLVVNLFQPLYDEAKKHNKVLRGMGQPITEVMPNTASADGVSEKDHEFLAKTLGFTLIYAQGYER